jgi:hypothetical protein
MLWKWEVKLHTFLTWVLNLGMGSLSHPYLWIGWWAGPQTMSRWRGKKNIPAGNLIKIIWSIARHLTNWAIPAFDSFTMVKCNTIHSVILTEQLNADIPLLPHIIQINLSWLVSTAPFPRVSMAWLSKPLI